MPSIPPLTRRYHRVWLTTFGLLLSALLPFKSATASNAITLDVGYGQSDVKLMRFNMLFGDYQTNLASNGWRWYQYWEGNLSYWYLYKDNGGERNLFELGFTPNFRLERIEAEKLGRPYLEAGIGVHLLSKVHIGQRNLSSAFQFGTHLGFGLRFGDKEQWDIGWRFEHLSNAGLQSPNPGINFAMLRFGYHW